jgi:xylulokinase
MSIIAVDLGTTNIKVAAFDNALKALSSRSQGVEYLRERDAVEFDAEEYYRTLVECIRACCGDAGVPAGSVCQLVFTGQAESLVLLGKDARPLRNAISWLDMRSEAECQQLQQRFPKDVTYRITGLPSIIPTWPISKMLWLQKHEEELVRRVWKYLLLKDYILFRLTGELAGEHSIYNFSHYFDIRKKQYWREILEFCGVGLEQLPPLVEPQTVLGRLSDEAARTLGLPVNTRVNVGTLDHFAGMLGTGNICEGIISESTGTVLSIATMVRHAACPDVRLPLHCGPLRNSYVYLPVCESGGISLDWFKDRFLVGVDYQQLNAEIGKHAAKSDLLFLPNITGVNAPDFNASSSGVFFGLRLHHDTYDLALAVMEGIAHLLRRNIDCFADVGIKASSIISTGGGARSDIWSQLKANVTGHTVSIPENEEAATLGAAMIGAVSEGFFSSFGQAAGECVAITKYFQPKETEFYAQKHETFKLLYSQLQPVFARHRQASG